MANVGRVSHKWATVSTTFLIREGNVDAHGRKLDRVESEEKHSNEMKNRRTVFLHDYGTTEH
jgi:hypothetical protein